jgi:glutamate racemase
LKAQTARVGIFDSGVGGLSTLAEIRRELPAARLIYVADSVHAPYGDKPRPLVQRRCIEICDFLVGRECQALVVACNTATGAAIDILRERYSLPVLGMEPALKPAVAQTTSGVVGILATGGTLASDKFARLQARVAGAHRILLQPCPGLVERVESGDLEGETVRAMLERYLQPLLRECVDTLVLGCTHYPFLAGLIGEIAGPGIQLVDPSPAVARELCRRLNEGTAKSQVSGNAGEEFWTSGDPARVAVVVAKLWGAPVKIRRLGTYAGTHR